MSISDILEKLKNLFSSKTKRLEGSKDKQFRIECEKDGRIQEYQDYLNYKKICLEDIARFKKNIYQGKDVSRWKYTLKDTQRSIDFLRPNSPEDIQERDYWRSNFYNEFLKVVPENIDLRFHGTSIYNTKAILESGGIFSSVDINDGYMASTDMSGEISASTVNSLNRTIQGWFADLGAYVRGLPCGCIFALNPRTEKDKELSKYDAMESVNFRVHPEQLYGIFTSKENVSNVKEWLENAGFSADLVYTFEGFLKKLEKEKNSNFRSSIIVNKDLGYSSNNLEQKSSDFKNDDLELDIDK